MRKGSLRQAGELLSELSGAAAVVTSSPIDGRLLAQVRFIRTKPDQLLAVIVFKDGMVENRYIPVAKPIGDSELERVHNLLADVVEGRTLGALRELFVRRLADDRVVVDQLRLRAFELGSQALQRAPRRADAVVIEGRSRLLEMPEFADAARLKALVRTLEDREHLVGLLDETMDAGLVTVYLGGETGADGEAEISLVAAPYGSEGEGRGSVGVIGPTRMDYARMMPLVEATAEVMTEALKRRDDE
jgi:heat-inducible transcriptional repressor